jgi:hypothetical protein
VGARRPNRALLGTLLALGVGCGGGRAAAQAPAPATVEAVPVQGLTFGPLLPGVPEQVRVSDGARRAEFLLAGEGTVDVALLLPAAMTSPDGTRIPLRFEAADGALLRNASAAPLPVNPLGTIRVQLQGAQTPTRLLLGGTALPARDQAAGSYTTTLVLVVVNAGT